MKVTVRKVRKKAVDLKKVEDMLTEMDRKGELEPVWFQAVREMSSERLRRLVRTGKLDDAFLFVVLEELARRREASGQPFRSNEEAWAAFQEHYMPRFPSYHGEECPGRGDVPGFECQCDECEHYLECFSDWEK